MEDKSTTNLANFNPKGGLGGLLVRAKEHNRLNEKLRPLLSKQFEGIVLCLVADNVATFLAPNSSIAFRTNKQRAQLLQIIRQIESLSTIENVVIKVGKSDA